MAIHVDSADRRAAVDWASVVIAAAAILFAIMFGIWVLWQVLAKQDSKLYEADNVVCVSQPYAVSCFERKPR